MDLSSAPLHIFLGPNNSGKSSACDAVEYALTGLARTLLVKKDAGSFLSRKGCDDMAVELFWEGGQLRRTPSGCSLAERDVEAIFGPASQVRASLSGFRFLSQPARDRRELVAGVTGKKADIGTALTKVCKAAGLPADLTEKLVKMADEDIDHAETFAVEQRKAAKRSLEAYALPGMNAPDKVVLGGKEFDLNKATPDAVGARLAARKQERDEALRNAGTASLLDKPELIEPKIAALDKEIAAAPKADEKAVAAVEKLIAELDAAIANHTKAANMARGKLEAARQDAKRFDDLGGKTQCPLCQQKVDGSLMGKLYDEAVAAGDQADADVRAAEDMVKQAQANRKGLADKLSALKGAGELRAELAKKRQGLAEDLAESKSHDTWEAKAKELTAAVETGEKLLEASQLYQAGKARTRNEADVKHAVEVWDKVAKALGPDGDIRKMTAAGFDQAIPKDAALKLVGKPLEVDENWNITLGGILAPGCSRSERLRMGAGFATAFAVAGKLGIVVIDEADILQASNRKALTGWLLGHAGQVGTFLLGSTRDGKPEAGSPDPRVKMWWCEGEEVAAL